MKESEQLTVFIEVAKHKSFAEAARSLNQPTTTISRKINLLEVELNSKLFYRTTRSLSLTEVGERLLPKAAQVIESINELRDEIHFYSRQPNGILHISAPPTIFQLLSPLFSEFKNQHSNIQFNLESSSRYHNLTENRLDFAFRVGKLEDSSLISLPLCTFRNVLVCSKVFFHKHSLRTCPQDLNKVQCIRNQIDGLVLPWRLVKGNEQFFIETEEHILSDDLLVSLELSIAGLGVANLPIAQTDSAVKSGQLVRIFDEWMQSTRELHLVYPSRQHLALKSKVFIDFIRRKRHIIQKLVGIEDI